MKYKIVVTTVETTTVEVPSREVAESLARTFQKEVNRETARTLPVQSSCQRTTVGRVLAWGADGPEGRIADLA